MSNFLLKKPEAVLIHIPKTAGSSIRYGAWNGRYDGPVFGYIPDEWKHLFKFAFIRHPIDRLVSAWLMFSCGTIASPVRNKRRLIECLQIRSRTVVTIVNREAISSNMSLETFIKIASNEQIPYDYSTLANIPVDVDIRHHTLPQTHQFNCLDKADFVGRYESFQDECRAISERLKVNCYVPTFNKTYRDIDWRSYMSSSTLEAALDFYRDDFRELGYELPRTRER